MTTEPGLDDFARMRALGDLLTPNAMRVAVTLDLPEMLAESPATSDDLARRTGSHADALRSVLAVLRHSGFLELSDDGAYSLTTLGRTLLHPHARVGYDLTGAPAHIDSSFAALAETVRTGGPAYASVQGQGFWEHLDSDPALSASFDSYLSMHAVEWVAGVAALDVWADASHLVDVGGGDGYALATIAAAHPHLSGTVVDLAGPAGRAAERFRAAGVADRLGVHVGSFFDPLPDDGDTYLLAHILHDWPDDESVAVLRRVAEAAPVRVLVVDQIIDEERSDFVQAWSDLRMRSLFGSCERTRAQWDALANAASLRLVAVHPWGAGGSVLEFTPS